MLNPTIKKKITQSICNHFGPSRVVTPTIEAPGADFVEDSFSMGWAAGRMIQAVMRAMGNSR